MNINQLMEQALERAGGNKILAEVLVKLVNGLITPIEDPLYDWQIKKLSEVKALIEQKDSLGYTWRTLPDVIRTRQFEAPLKQCALAWGTRKVPGNEEPSPLALLVWVTRGEDGGIQPAIGAQFYYMQARQNQPARWFVPDGFGLDPVAADAMVYFLNSLNGASKTSVNRVGVDLDDEPQEENNEP